LGDSRVPKHQFPSVSHNPDHLSEHRKCLSQSWKIDAEALLISDFSNDTTWPETRKSLLQQLSFAGFMELAAE
jgi:hypothetical protein